MDTFIQYLTEQIDAGKAEIARLEEDGCRDDADFAKVRTNIYEVCRTVTNALANRPGAGPEAIKKQFENFRTIWGAALANAGKHDDARSIVIEEAKLKALADVTAHFPEAAK
jgi:hypothetical protein